MKITSSENIPVSIIDEDPNLKLETNGLIRTAFNVFFVPFLNHLPRNFKKVIRRTNTAAAIVIDNTTSHKALEALYSKGGMFSFKKMGSNFFRFVWFNLDNSKAVRNRLKFVKRELRLHLQNISKFDRDIEIMSIASGSSRAIIETVEEGSYLKGTKLSLTFLDNSDEAIIYSKDLSTRINHLPIKLNWIQDSAGSFLRGTSEQKYDIIEIVGLLDYFTDEKVVETFQGVYDRLEEGGILITSNINHNAEEKFITKVIDWPMIYRKAEELAELANQAKFEYNKMKVFYEPLRIHGMVVAKK